MGSAKLKEKKTLQRSPENDGLTLRSRHIGWTNSLSTFEKSAANPSELGVEVRDEGLNINSNKIREIPDIERNEKIQSWYKRLFESKLAYTIESGLVSEMSIEQF